jgi:hypothetical protein
VEGEDWEDGVGVLRWPIQTPPFATQPPPPDCLSHPPVKLFVRDVHARDRCSKRRQRPLIRLIPLPASTRVPMPLRLVILA